jgi:uncharacterized protein (TIGR03435 family)
MRYALRVLSVTVLCTTAWAIQNVNPSPLPSFEVASIKPNKSGRAEMDFQPLIGGRFTVGNVTLKTLIVSAFRVTDFQILGGPGWMDSDRFDVNAKAGRNVSLNEALQMLQTLLKERFMLVAHREMREQTIYSLKAIKDRPNLTPTRGNDEGGVKVLPVPGQTSALQVVGKNMTMQHLADVIGSQLRGPVHDQTGLTGSFDFAFTLDKPPDVPGGTEPDLTSAIVTALQEQLGLKLEANKGQADILVVDSAERPTEN